MKWIKRLIPYVVALVIIALLLSQIHPIAIIHLLIGIDWRWLLVAIGAYAFTNLMRAFRFNALLELHAAKPSSHLIGPVASQHKDVQGVSGRVGGLLAAAQLLPEMFALSFFNNTLPSRSGEVSFPYFMWRRHKVAVGESSAALIVVRIFDYMAMSLLYVVCASANLHRLAPSATSAVWAVGLLLVISLALLLSAPWLGQRVLDALWWLMRRLSLDQRHAVRVVLGVVQQAVDHFRKIRSFRAYAITLGWSLLTWIGTFAWFAASMQGIGVGQPYGLVVVGATFASLAKAVPFITIGGFGAHEAGWTVGFSLVGMPVSIAIASGFAVNILTLLMSVVFGGAALAFMAVQEKRIGRTTEDAQALAATGGSIPSDVASRDRIAP